MKTLLDREDLVFNSSELGCVLSLSELPGGGSKIYDRSPYGNIGSITGAAWKRLPSGLWVLSFDGQDDYVDCGDNNSLEFTTGPFTLLAWIYPTLLAAGLPQIFCRTDDGINGYYLCSESGGELRLYGGGIL
jgi:hypothetical protein